MFIIDAYKELDFCCYESTSSFFYVERGSWQFRFNPRRIGIRHEVV